MRNERRFAVFILTHGRPDHVVTLGSLRRSGYTGAWYLLVDDEDPTAEEYRRTHGAEHVIQFCKADAAELFDPADSSPDRRTDTYARNASFGIAQSLGLTHFLQLDDDYQFFGYRYAGAPLGATHPQVKDLDAVNEAMLDFLDSSGAASVAMAQGGDYIGGGMNARRGLKRKAMNSFYLRTDRPVTFIGRLNNDVNTYVVAGGKGDLFFTVMALQLVQANTQTSAGGMTDAYQASGTYVKSFYTVMMAPSCVTVSPMGPVNPRYHHLIRWDHAVPKILSPKHRKLSAQGRTS